MNSPHDPNGLFAPERPVRSDFARRQKGLSYAARRILTLLILASAVLGGIFWAWSRMAPSVPGEIPTIKAEGSYKQRPEQPGGVDIPNQDVQVYHEIDGAASANADKHVVEHMLPPPEEPNVKILPAASTPADTNLSQTAQVEELTPRAPIEVPVPVVEAPKETAPPPVTAPAAKTAPAKSVPVAPAAVAPVAAPVTQSVPKGGAVVQLAALPDEQAANAMIQKLQSKYAAILGATHLHSVRADLGAKGVFYRIQSQSMSDAQAKSICAELKNQNAGCLTIAVH